VPRRRRGDAGGPDDRGRRNDGGNGGDDGGNGGNAGGGGEANGDVPGEDASFDVEVDLSPGSTFFVRCPAVPRLPEGAGSGGEPFQCGVSLRGEEPADEVVVEFTWPGIAAIESSLGPCDKDGDTFRCTLGDLEAGDLLDLTVRPGGADFARRIDLRVAAQGIAPRTARARVTEEQTEASP
jgi:hypothetical protein